MDIRQLEVFVCLADRQSFSQAATALHLSQPTVSAHLQALEQELRTQLIRRTTRAFSLTDDGRRLYQRAQQILSLQQKTLADFTGGNRTELTVGSSSVPSLCILPDALCRFTQQYPDTQLRVTRSDSLDVMQKVASGALDVGFVGTKGDISCVFVPLAADRLVIATPNTPYYRTLMDRHVTLAEWLREPFLLRSEQSGTQREWERALDTLCPGREPLHVIARIDDAEVLRACISRGLGITILSRQVVEPLSQSGSVLLTELEGAEWNRTLYLAHRPEPYMRKITEDFVRSVCDAYHV